MSFHAPVKELQPVDTSLPEYCIKGAVVLDPQLTEWNKKAIISSTCLPSTFLQINRQEQKIGEILRNAANGLQLPPNEQYGLISEEPKRFITDYNLDSLNNGFMLTMSASPDHYVQRINEILSQGNDLKKMEWAVAKLDEFSLDLALIEAFYKFSSLDLLYSLVRDDRVCMSSTLLSTCLRALSKMLELGVDSVGWQCVPRDVVVSVSSMVTGKAKREEANALLFALQMIEQLVNCDSTTREWVLEEVPIETLIRHVEKSDERISISALSLMNSMIEKCTNPEKRVEMIKALEVVPFRNAVHSSLLRTGKPRDSQSLQQLIQVQKQLISVYDLGEPVENDIQKILEIEQFDDELKKEEENVEFRRLLQNNRCGKLTCRAILRISEYHQQDLKMILSENIMRIEGGKWRFIPLSIKCVGIAAELFGILPGRDELSRLIPILFSSEHIFDEIVWVILQLFHRTWREMHAKNGELEKVASVVMEQLRFVLKMEQSHIEGLEESLERFTYRNLQEIWKDEQEEKENDQLHSQSVTILAQKLRPKMEEIVGINNRNYMKEGHVFRKNSKGKSKQAFWFWKLDSSEKFITIRMCDEEGNSGQMEEIKQIWLKDIIDVINNDESDRKTSSSRFTSSGGNSGIMSRGLRVELKNETLNASTFDEKICTIWIDGLLELTGNSKKDNRSRTDEMVDRLLKMELRVRLLNVKSSETSQPPEIPPFPETFPFPSCT
ncbi:unnamed protein product [Caenorhabditis angaria]|uniref:ELMO domain-containing protein n=1 Tax=Caenorhabditis angaria TaxID=860376 RepID=A0A9P1I3F9_9PELO|nr:unnamed protein product [Caenorhabditis angaria]